MKNCLSFLFLSFSIYSFSNAYSNINPFIDSLSPKQNEVSVSRSSEMSVYFSGAMNPSTLNSGNIKVHASETGLLNVSISYRVETYKLIITPASDFKAGELISIHLSGGIRTAANTPITPFVYSFTGKSNTANAHFSSQISINVGGDPRFVTAGDFNRDGSVDLAVTNYATNNFSILKNNGNKTFTQTQLIPFRNATLLNTGDYNCDGFLDLIVSRQYFDMFSSDTAGIVLYKNNGAGVFVFDATIMTGSLVLGADALTSVDFNGDGYLDFISWTKGSGDRKIVVYKNANGNGFYKLSELINSGFNGMLTSGDFDNDGDMDAALFNYVFLNNGLGTFSYNLFNSETAWSLVNSDFNKDNYLDIAVPLSSLNLSRVFGNSGNGTFTILTQNNIGSFPVYPASGDFNGDGNIDMAVMSINKNSFSKLINNGTGTFTSSTILNNLGTTGGGGFISSDLDGDGSIDIVSVNRPTDNITIFYNEAVNSISNNNGVPNKFELAQNYPNPFNPITNIEFEIPKYNYVSLKIYDHLGREIKTILSEFKSAGHYTINFNGEFTSSGTYFYTLESGDFKETKSMVLIK